ncbi:MAG: T9SS type A sorting domain-containing protein [Flavobacteriales bacterium]
MNPKLWLPLLFAFSSFIPFDFHAQGTYIYKTGFNEAALYMLDGNNNISLVTLLDNSETIFADIAVNGAGEVFGVTTSGEIHLINLENGTTSQVAAFSEFTAHTALVCDSESNFYSLDFFYNIYVLNLETLEEELLFNVGELTPGDLGFYDGKLVFPSSLEPVLKTFDLETNEVSTIYSLPQEIVEFNDIYGICNLFHACGEESLIVGTMSGSVFLIDVENDIYLDLNVEYNPEIGGNLNGIASSGDVLSSACNDPITSIENASNLDVNCEQKTALIYPNPAPELIFLSCSETVERIEFIDFKGEIVKIIEQPGRQISVVDLAAGVYNLKIYHTSGEETRERMVKV